MSRATARFRMPAALLAGGVLGAALFVVNMYGFTALFPWFVASRDGITLATRTFTLEKGKDNLLDAGLRSGIELPYSCKGGVCSTCRCRIIEGEVDMDVNFALEDYEVERGFILACQSYPVTDKVKVTFDDTGTG